MKANNQKISQSIDEWTSFRNRRYINIHVYYTNGESDNLGMIRVEGSCPAEKMQLLVTDKLQSLGISFAKDIISSTTDRTSVMIKFGALSPAHLQLCYNHAIHLAILKLFYKLRRNANDISTHISSSSDSEECDDGFPNENFFEGEYSLHNELCDSLNINITINKIRNIVKLFKNSPVRNSVLQNYCKLGQGNEVQLSLDCRTRWNSMVAMIEKFTRLQEPISKALIDLNLCHLWDDILCKAAIHIINTLKPVSIAVEALSRKDCNLLKGEGILKFLFESLGDKDNNNELSFNLLNELKLELGKRRDVSLISLIKFLHDPHCLSLGSQEENDFFKLLTKNQIVKTAKYYMAKFTENDVVGSETDNDNGQSVVSTQQTVDSLLLPSTSTQSLKEKLEHSIQNSLAFTPINNDSTRTLHREINLFEATGQITPNLKKLKDALLTIRPTSTQNERNFSTSGHLVV